MKIKRLHWAMLPLILPTAAFALGMGDIKVESLLDQPFRAEIPLIDVAGTPLTGISVAVASLENFERVGIERAEVLNLLKLKVIKNEYGQPVISITSTERIPEPYIELVVDMAWAKGQLYRAYTVLLDPPDYNLNPALRRAAYSPHANQPGVVNKPVYTAVVDHSPDGNKFSRKQATYGPTMANESIWQIAQRYSTSDTTLPQIILAIVGTNSDAFTQGNLNGLKVGSRLKIPSTDEVLRVPENLAKQELDAHDLAWKNKTEIRHVLLPPYIDGVAGETQFTSQNGTQDTKPSVPEPLVKEPVTTVPTPIVQPVSETTGQPAVVPASSGSATATPTSNLTQTPANVGPDRAQLLLTIETLQTQLKDTKGLVDSIRKENATVKSQLQTLESKTVPLQKTLAEQNTAIANLHQKLKSLNTEPSESTTKTEEEQPFSIWLVLMPLIAVAGGCALGYLARRRAERNQGLDDDNTVTEPVKPVAPPVLSLIEAIKPEEPAETPVTEPSPEYQAPLAPEEQPETERIEPLDVITPPVTPESHDSEPDVIEPEFVAEPAREPEPVPEPEPEPEPEPDVTEAPSKETNDDNEDFLLEFEPGLDKLLATQPKEASADIVTDEADQSAIDFVSQEIQSPVEPTHGDDSQTEQVLFDSILSTDTTPDTVGDDNETKPVEWSADPVTAPEPAAEEAPAKVEDKPVKSSLALDTLLDLAKTYISMDDREAARQSLQEVITFGTESQQAEAQTLLKDLDAS